MKTTRTLLTAFAMMAATVAMNAQPMSYESMRHNARFLTDRMAYTLGLGAELLDDLYYINYDYICGVNDYLDDVAMGYRTNDYYAVLAARDLALQALLTPYQWSRLMAIDYFYRPISFYGHRWRFGIYAYDHYNRWYFGTPWGWDRYRGGHFFGGMRPGGGHVAHFRPGHFGEHGRGGHFGPGGAPGGNNRGGNMGGNPGGSMGGNTPGGNNRGGNMNGNPGNNGGGNPGGTAAPSNRNIVGSRSIGSVQTQRNTTAPSRSIGSSAPSTPSRSAGTVNRSSVSSSRSGFSGRSSSSTSVGGRGGSVSGRSASPSGGRSAGRR